MLTPRHLAELLKSGINPDVAALNFHSLTGNTPYDYLLYSDALKRTNPGRLAAGLLNKYRHVEQGGWWASGLDPLRNWEPMPWGQFKPDKARVDSSGKKVKYEPPPQTSTRAYFFQISFLQSWRIAKRQKGQFYEAGFKGFGKAPKFSSERNIQKLIEQVDIQTATNQANLEALENFTRLVNEGNTQELINYFKQYGVDPGITRLNLDVLIAEELKDLAH
jgi:hypothetical protein